MGLAHAFRDQPPCVTADRDDDTPDLSLDFPNATSCMKRVDYRAEIDGLRAIAVSSVVLYHAGVGGAGFVGVDVFFVISGYLITRILETEYRARGRIDLVEFYARRVRRILPALTLVIVATVLASALLLPPYDELRGVTSSATASLLFVANLYFQMGTGGYFDTATERLPLLHLWSLGVEEQFYLIWPVLLIALLRLPGWWARLLMSLLLVASLAFAEYALYALHANVAFYQMPARFWELGAGGAIALWRAPHWPRAALGATVGLLLVLLTLPFPLAHFPGLGALPPVLGTALVIAAVHSGVPLGVAGRLLGSRPMVTLGLISYSLYLWHWPLLALARNLSASEPSAATRLALCTLAVVLAAATYRWVEQPLRRPDGRTGPGRLCAAALLVTVSLAVAAHTAGGALAGRPPPMDFASRVSRDGPPNRFICNFRGEETLDQFPKEGCIVGGARPVRVAVWGDSHALAWQPFAWTLADSQAVGSISFVRDACPPALAFDNGKRRAERDLCMAFNARTVDALMGFDTLVIASRWPTGARHAAFQAAFASTLARLAPRVSRIILLGPTPELPGAVPQCLRLGAPGDCTLGRVAHETRIGPTREALSGYAARYPNVEFVEVTDFFCNASQCPPTKDGYGLFWDSNHVTTTAARHFAAGYLSGSRETAVPTDSGR